MIVRVLGGLGNQMFQYAMARKQNIDKGVDIILDIDCDNKFCPRKYELNKFQIVDFPIIDYKSVKKYRYYRRICDKAVYIWSKLFKEKYSNGDIRPDKKRPFSWFLDYGYEKEEFVFQDDLDFKYIDGYWQNVYYFKDIRNVLINEYKYLWEYSDIQNLIISQIESNDSVSIHVRRGDYLAEENKNFYEVQDMDYYFRAIEFIKKKTENPIFYIFSDDINWCKKNFPNESNFHFIDFNINKYAVQDFEMMKRCKHHIISNSTFSWWAAWLSTDCNIIIAPSKWYKNSCLNDKCKKALLEGMIQI